MKKYLTMLFVLTMISFSTFGEVGWGKRIGGGFFSRLEKYKPSSETIENWLAGDLQELISAAEKNDSEAQYLLARCYDFRKEYDKSPQWYEAAAQNGQKDAIRFLEAVNNFDPDEAQKTYDTMFEDVMMPMLKDYPDSIVPSALEAYSGRKFTTSQLMKESFAGESWAQNILGVRFENGDRVIEDYEEAYAWFLVASMNGSEKAKANKQRLKSILTPSQVSNGQKRAKGLSAEIERKKVISSANPDEVISAEILPSGYGSGLLVKGGFILTCWHVVDEAEKISIVVNGKNHVAHLIQHDEVNDIAVLQTPSATSTQALNYSDEVKLGEKVFTLGFPHPDLQGTDVKFTTGTISSLTGIGNSPRYYQISAPLQSGNSGGALFNEKGNFIGIVAAKLDSLATLSMTGDLPQNVNYAVKAGYAIPLLKTIEGFEVGSKRNDEVNLLDLIEELKQSVVMIKVY